MVDLVTEDGGKFKISAQVILGNKCYDMDQLTENQRRYIAGKLNEHAMNSAYAGRYGFCAEGLPDLEEAFGSENP